ncbi:MAG TPA: nucleotidyltransferase family protein [Mesorhizobium sp.]|jgi:MurNAc alpha-1-phosphate uridylyltransferase|nr:nucleotidyltransferase family protein [Mesorhizobium sp.]
MSGSVGIARAMVLAAGLGTRMRPITLSTPKPLVEVGGKALIDWGLDALADAGVALAVVNVHHLADQMEQHLQSRRRPEIVISDERGKLLDSAGGVVKALPILGDGPFLILNADTFWIDGAQDSLSRLLQAWDDASMDILLLLADPQNATGHSGSTDFLRDAEGRLSRAKGSPEGLIYAGAGIFHPRIFAGAEAKPHSLNLYFDRAISEGRLYGEHMDAHWITVGTPDAIASADAAVEAARAR